MPSIPLYPRASNPSARVNNPLPQLLRTPSGLALLELQGTINLPPQDNVENNESSSNPNAAPVFETPIGKLMFPDYSPQVTAPDDTKWMKRVYLYVGRYQRMTGEVKKLPQPLAVVQRRQKEPGATADDREELEIVEIVKYKIYFKSRPEPVNDI
nr:sister chromatid cohesion protein Ctf8 [Aspergillus niger CBS 513.88]|eukprot:XP_001401969.2 sister chromatid cohesion protein Ctf8 [Aspergillus niger CBS 513.88]